MHSAAPLCGGTDRNEFDSVLIGDGLHLLAWPRPKRIADRLGDHDLGFWLNMVEAWFGVFTRKSVRRGSFDSVAALVRHIDCYLAAWNSHPTPLVWTKDPAYIIRKAVRRGVNTTSRTRH